MSQLNFVSVGFGPEMNLIQVTIEVVDDPILTVNVTVNTIDFHQQSVVIQVGETGGNLNVGSWDAVAALVNASDAGAILQMSTGAGFNPDFPIIDAPLTGGTSNSGQILYYFEAGLVVLFPKLIILLPFVLPRRFCRTFCLVRSTRTCIQIEKEVYIE